MPFRRGGQQLFLNTGLILETKDPNQLIGVIAHETGHIAGGHLARSGGFTKAAMGPMLLSVGLGILAALAGQPGAAAGLIFSSGYFGEISALGYSREQESRADQAAATYLETAGMSGEGLVTFFDNFRYQEVFDDEKKYPFFRDHPLTDDRIEALRARVEHQAHLHAVDPPEAIARHALMKAKLEAFLDGPGQTFNDFPVTDTSFPGQIRPGHCLLSGDRDQERAPGHRRPNRRDARRSLSLRTARSGAVRGRAFEGGRDRPPPVRGAEAGRAPAPDQSRPGDDRRGRPHQARRSDQPDPQGHAAGTGQRPRLAA